MYFFLSVGNKGVLQEEYQRNYENEAHKTVPIPALELVKAEDFYGTNTGKIVFSFYTIYSLTGICHISDTTIARNTNLLLLYTTTKFFSSKKNLNK